MSKSILTICLWLFAIGLFSSCKELQPVTIGGVSNVKVDHISKEGIELDFDMKINNPNSVGVSVYPSSFDANLGGISVGKIKLVKRVRIKAKGEHTSTFHIKSDFSKLNLTDIASVVPMVLSKRADISLKGNLRVGKLFYKQKFPVELNKSIPLSK